MSIQKIDVVHLIGGLAQAANSLSSVPYSKGATDSILLEIQKLANAMAGSPANEVNLTEQPK